MYASIKIPCPVCSAKPGERCTNTTPGKEGRAIRSLHGGRMDLPTTNIGVDDPYPWPSQLRSTFSRELQEAKNAEREAIISSEMPSLREIAKMSESNLLRMKGLGRRGLNYIKVVSRNYIERTK